MNVEIRALCECVRQTAYDIHEFHGNGYLEKVYENALCHRLRKAGLSVSAQVPFTIKDEDGTVIGEYFADLLVNGVLIVELKTVKNLSNEHRSQVLHYLAATGLEHGLLINFAAYRFEIEKLVLTKPGKTNPKQRSL